MIRSLGVLLTVILLASACGRRGDPVPIMPPEISPDRGSGTAADVRKGPEESRSETGDPDSESQEVVPPGPPVHLTGVFTQKIIVLSWDGVTGQDIRYFRVYRSSGAGYAPIGETGNPAFTDRDIELNREYRYRVSAVGKAESPLSEPLLIQTTTP